MTEHIAARATARACPKTLLRAARLRPEPAAFVLAAALYVMPVRKTLGEERLDFKTMVYQEDNDRMRIVAPTFLYENEISPTLTIRLDGIYNAISGASPTGAPPTPAPNAAPQVSYSEVFSQPSSGGGGGGGGGDDDDEGDDDEHESEDGVIIGPARLALSPFSFVTGASGGGGGGGGGGGKKKSSSAPKPAPQAQTAPTTSSGGNAKVPKAKVEDERYGINLEIIKRLGRHTPSAQFSYSTEQDYESMGLALKDAIDFNQKNTTLLLGVGGTHDRITAKTLPSSKTKDSYDGMVGLTQVLSPRTLFAVNLSLGRAEGYLADPYKIVELNGKLVPEKRPESKDKKIVFLSLAQFFEALDGSAELSYRWYNDSFGITAHTYTLAWYQKLGPYFILSPMLRLYQQSQADFYDIRFTGSPEFYSSDYRVSKMEAMGYGIKLVWKPNERFSADLAFERYDQEGKDGKTSQDAYPTANIISAGVRLWF